MTLWKILLIIILWDILRALGICFFTKYLINKDKKRGK